MNRDVELVLISGQLVVLQSINGKEYHIKKSMGTFIYGLLTEHGTLFESIATKIGLCSIIRDKWVGHNYSLAYAYDKYVDYKNSPCVKRLEAKASKRQAIYLEAISTITSDDIYFLNPIVYKESLSILDKIGAILYFTSAVKCSALFHDKPHCSLKRVYATHQAIVF